MPTVTATKPRSKKPHRPARPKMTIRTTSGHLKLVVPYAPNQGTTYDGLAPTYQSTQLAGRVALSQRQYEPQPTIQYQLFFGHRDIEASCENDLKTLRKLAEASEALVVSFGAAEGGYWNITALSFSDEARKSTTNEMTRATASVTFTRASVHGSGYGPTTGGHKTPSKSKNHPRTYTVKKGDTLAGIATRVLHDTRRWREIATLNNIKHPKHLRIGRVLKMPK